MMQLLLKIKNAGDESLAFVFFTNTMNLNIQKQ